ncbi:hypothetical protein B296_00015875 [Ensete ventricosum]|uniref:Uncharacterized protein n=1 Tax=Ensete ventricosum TaxID=4639 RepID=A0A427AIW6_ENSVE|nr:hypothetical protein B296_00015875 [Ensete ventricosum]
MGRRNRCYMVALKHWWSWSLQWQQRKEAKQMSHRENIGDSKGMEEEGQQGRTMPVGSCGCNRGLEMAASGRGRRGVGVNDSGGDATREPDAGVSTAAAGDRWVGGSNGRGGDDDKGGASMLLCVAGDIADL